jgi:hypothetical protein
MKVFLSLAVVLVAVAALGAGAAGVPGIYQDHRNPHCQRLVSDECPQLVERPARQAVPRFTAANPYPVPDVSQVFEGYPSTGASGSINDPSADDVVLMATETGFLACYSPEFLLRSFGTSPLKSLPLEVVFATDLIHGLARVGGTIAVRSNLNDTQVNSEMILYRLCFGSLSLDLDVQEITSISSFDQGGRCRLPTTKSIPLAISQQGCQSLPRVQKSQAEGPVLLPETEDPGIVVNAGGSKGRLLFALQSSTDPGNGPDSQIGGQSELFTDVPVTGVLQDNLVGGLFLLGDIGDGVTSTGKGYQRSINLHRLLRSRVQLAHNRPNGFHNRILSHVIQRTRSMAKAKKRFLHWPVRTEITMMSEQAPRINAVTEHKPVVCIVCGKPFHSVNPFRVIQLQPLLCSVDCLQAYLDKYGATIRCEGSGDTIVVPPGGIRVSHEGGSEPTGFPLEEGGMPETIVTVEMSPVLDQPSESPVKE